MLECLNFGILECEFNITTSIEKKEILNLEKNHVANCKKNEKLHNPLKFVKIICQPLKNSVGVFEVLVTPLISKKDWIKLLQLSVDSTFQRPS